MKNCFHFRDSFLLFSILKFVKTLSLETENFRTLVLYTSGHSDYWKFNTCQIYLAPRTASIHMALHTETIVSM